MQEQRSRDGRGFTLVELIVVITLASLLLTLAVPSFRELTQNSRITSRINELLVALYLTRSEAIKRNRRVVMCRSVNQTSCDLDASRDRQWETGWIVFVDLNTNGQIDTGEALLRVGAPLDPGLTLRSGGNYSRHVGFHPIGRPRGNTGLANDTFRLCDERGTDKARKLVVSISGRMRIASGADEPFDCPTV